MTSSDGSSDAYAAIMMTGIVSLCLLVVVSAATWWHVRHEAKKDAECEAWGGVRIEAAKDYCIRKDAIIYPDANRRYGCSVEQAAPNGECQ